MWWLSIAEKNKKWERENQESGIEILSTATGKQSLKDMRKWMMPKKTRKEQIRSRQQEQEVQKFWGRSVSTGFKE